MKLLFLFLAILLATEPVMPGKSLRCMATIGTCRHSCKKNEHPYYHCRDYQTCCLPSFMRISITGTDENNEWSDGNYWPQAP
ncbi:beta-defensin 119 [Cavia porcellus]|uniref:Defensin beta 119 n=1 Tax=Cavia porcellus TaxID=10141 RepID=H0VDH9_CAVPO|nr:beta-defensin 119 [Cavia porcellus]